METTTTPITVQTTINAPIAKVWDQLDTSPSTLPNGARHHPIGTPPTLITTRAPAVNLKLLWPLKTVASVLILKAYTATLK
jgi:hypothetical protein